MNAPLILLITLINLYIHGLASAKGTKGSAQAKTVKVFILAGQSNMEGHGLIKGRPGQVGTLEQLTNDPKTSKQYKKLKILKTYIKPRCATKGGGRVQVCKRCRFLGFRFF